MAIGAYSRGAHGPGAAAAVRSCAALCLLALPVGCSSCEEPSLQTRKPYPHTRCLAVAPGEDRRIQQGELTFSLEGRTLTVAGTPDSVRIAAFSGPGLARAAGPKEIAALAEREPTLAVMLGGLGDDDATASETLAALASAPFPTLFVPGGRDDLRRLDALLSARKRGERAAFLNLAPVRVVRIGSHELLPIAGAADGRYALNGHCCGFSLSDLQAAAGELPAPTAGGGRFLLSWQAPGRGGPHAAARTASGLDVGSDDLAEFARRVGASGGLFAWPVVRVAEPTAGGGQRRLRAGQAAPDLRLVVPRLTGRPLVTDDGGRVGPGFAMLVLDGAGLRMLGRVEIAAI